MTKALVYPPEKIDREVKTLLSEERDSEKKSTKNRLRLARLFHEMRLKFEAKDPDSLLVGCKSFRQWMMKRIKEDQQDGSDHEIGLRYAYFLEGAAEHLLVKHEDSVFEGMGIKKILALSYYAKQKGHLTDSILEYARNPENSAKDVFLQCRLELFGDSPDHEDKGSGQLVVLPSNGKGQNQIVIETGDEQHKRIMEDLQAILPAIGGDSTRSAAEAIEHAVHGLRVELESEESQAQREIAGLPEDRRIVAGRDALQLCFDILSWVSGSEICPSCGAALPHDSNVTGCCIAKWESKANGILSFLYPRGEGKGNGNGKSHFSCDELVPGPHLDS